MKAAMVGIQHKFRGNFRRLVVLLVPVAISVGILYTWLREPTAKHEIPDQIAEAHLYYPELVSHSPVFSLDYLHLNHVSSHASKVPKFNSTKPVVFVVTKTYSRTFQRAELTNMCNTMKHGSNIFWIVIEDTLHKTEYVKQFLIHCGLPAVHMNFKSAFEQHYSADQRNAAIEWIKRNTNVAYGNSVLYFADDENTYDPEIFEEMQYTRRVSVWPVGFVGRSRTEGPIVRHGKILDWSTSVHQHRKFPVNTAGFAVNFRFMSDKPAAKFQDGVPERFVETTFLQALGLEDMDLEPRADNCTKVLVWRTQTQPQYKASPHSKRGSAIPYFEP